MQISKELQECIKVVVRAGGTVKLPIPWATNLTSATLDALDKGWADLGIRVRQDSRSHYFPTRVQELRRKYGMSALSAYRDHLVFEPEPRGEDVAHV